MDWIQSNIPETELTRRICNQHNIPFMIWYDRTIYDGYFMFKNEEDKKIIEAAYAEIKNKL